MASKKPDDIQLTLTNAQRSLDAGIAGADQVRAEKLSALHNVRAVKGALLLRESDRLTAKYNANDQRVAALAKRITLNDRLKLGLKIESARSRTAVPKADAATWILIGHVFDQQFTGVPDLTVSLCDEKRDWLKQAGYSCTDNAGYFTLSLKWEKPASKLTEIDRVETSSAFPKAVFIRVTDRQKTVLFLDTEPSVPSYGAVTYRQIILEKTPPCPSPEESNKPKPGTSGTPPKPAPTRPVSPAPLASTTAAAAPAKEAPAPEVPLPVTPKSASPTPAAPSKAPMSDKTAKPGGKTPK